MYRHVRSCELLVFGKRLIEVAQVCVCRIVGLNIGFNCIWVSVEAYFTTLLNCEFLNDYVLKCEPVTAVVESVFAPDIEVIVGRAIDQTQITLAAGFDFVASYGVHYKGHGSIACHIDTDVHVVFRWCIISCGGLCAECAHGLRGIIEDLLLHPK